MKKLLLVFSLVFSVFLAIGRPALALTYRPGYDRSPAGTRVVGPVKIGYYLLKAEFTANATGACGAPNVPIKWEFQIIGTTQHVGHMYGAPPADGYFSEVFNLPSDNYVVVQIKTYNIIGATCQTLTLEYDNANTIFSVVAPSTGFICNSDGSICEASEGMKDFMNFRVQFDTVFFCIVLFFLILIFIVSLTK
jgi:hypothetical protein